MLLDDSLLDRITEEARKCVRLRMNYNLHDSPDSKAQRLLNALEPGTILPIHRHCLTDETYIVIRGRLKVTFYDGKMNIIECDELDPQIGKFGVQIPKNTWHGVEALESGTVIFEVKDGPYTSLTAENILN